VLEQATAELIGAELHRSVRDEHTGLYLDAWATELIGRSVDWMADAAGQGDDAGRGSWRLLHGLAASGSIVLELYIIGNESRAQMDNWFRGPRRIHETIGALHERGVVLAEYGLQYHDIDVAPMAVPFTAWYSERHGHEPHREAVEALAEDRRVRISQPECRPAVEAIIALTDQVCPELSRWASSRTFRRSAGTAPPPG
jgi:hypothetical protein